MINRINEIIIYYMIKIMSLKWNFDEWLILRVGKYWNNRMLIYRLKYRSWFMMFEIYAARDIWKIEWNDNIEWMK